MSTIGGTGDCVTFVYGKTFQIVTVGGKTSKHQALSGCCNLNCKIQKQGGVCLNQRNQALITDEVGHLGHLIRV